MKTKEFQMNSMGAVSLKLYQGVNEDLSDVIVQRRTRVAGGFGLEEQVGMKIARDLEQAGRKCHCFGKY